MRTPLRWVCVWCLFVGAHVCWHSEHWRMSTHPRGRWLKGKSLYTVFDTMLSWYWGTFAFCIRLSIHKLLCVISVNGMTCACVWIFLKQFSKFVMFFRCAKTEYSFSAFKTPTPLRHSQQPRRRTRASFGSPEMELQSLPLMSRSRGTTPRSKRGTPRCKSATPRSKLNISVDMSPKVKTPTRFRPMDFKWTFSLNPLRLNQKGCHFANKICNFNFSYENGILILI